MRRVRRGRVVADGSCTCWLHDHPHPPAYPFHNPSRRRFAAPVSRDERVQGLLDAGCTTCAAVAGGTYDDYLSRTGQR